MSMAMKYAMKKRMAKSGGSCADCAAGNCMAHGGEIGVHPVASGDAGYEGRSVAGRSVQNKTKHGIEDAKKEHKKVLHELKSMKKPHLFADGGEVEEPKGPPVDPEKAKKAEESMRKAFGYAEGGQVDSGSGFSDDMVSRIMKHRYSEGGKVANDTDMSTDAAPNEFDDLVLRDDLDSSYDGENSGDEIGNAAEEQDQKDIISRIMKSRSKKDRMPRPA